VEVFFVDYGDVEYLSCDKLLPMPVVLRRMPFQAIECSCLDVEPLNVQWTEDDCDAFHNLFYDKNLLAQVCHSMPCSCGPTGCLQLMEILEIHWNLIVPR